MLCFRFDNGNGNISVDVIDVRKHQSSSVSYTIINDESSKIIK